MACAVVSDHEVSLRYDICLISIASYMVVAFGNAGIGVASSDYDEFSVLLALCVSCSYTYQFLTQVCFCPPFHVVFDC